MPRNWTWLCLLLLTASLFVLADLSSSPVHAVAQGGDWLTEPIPPPSDEQRQASMRARIGWDNAKYRLKADMPNGRGIVVGQVEAPNAEGYLASRDHAHTPGTGYIPHSGSAKPSPHATAVASNIAGPQSAGQGIREVHGWLVSDWLGDGYLQTATPKEPNPDKQPIRIFNHSWISSGQVATLVLRRVDYLIDMQDIIMVCGLDNNKGPAPAMLASAYNVISVGVMNGQHSSDPTQFDGEGRSKPELVAPGSKTSFSTGVVTGCVAALLQQADHRVEQAEQAEKPEPDDRPAPAELVVPMQDMNRFASHSEVIKALLLAGADRPENWSAPEGRTLDPTFGAGVVDLDRALVMLDAGPVSPDIEEDSRQRYAWSFAQINPGQQRVYRFKVDIAQAEAGIALVWNRRVLGGTAELVNKETDARQTIWNSAAYLPNLDLALMRMTDGGEEEVAICKSKVDNVELIHLRPLEPGRYELRIVREKEGPPIPWDYALAWRIEAREIVVEPEASQQAN